jgi:hypothetical protein
VRARCDQSGLPRPPRSAAVSLTVPENAGITYAEAMTRVRREENLGELDITNIRPRRAATGALILEIPGREEGREKASLLAERMASVLRNTPIKVAVPRETTELRVAGLEDSVTLEEVMATVSEAGGCNAGEVSAGVLRFATRGLGLVWLRYPLAAARKIIMEGGRPKMGWTRAKVHPPPCARTPVLQVSGTRARKTGLQIGDRPIRPMLPVGGTRASV